MKYYAALLFFALATSLTQAQTPLVGPGSSTYSNIFSPTHTTTFDVPGGGTGLTVSDGSILEPTGIWSLTAQGGANASILGDLVESAAQTELTGTSLRFGLTADNNALLPLLLLGGNVHYAWEGKAVFGTPGSELNYSDMTNYHLSFDVDGSDGLLASVSGLSPSFSVELIDGSGNAIASQSSGTLVNIGGLLGTGVTTGTINLDFDLNGGVVPTGPIGVRFKGDAQLGSTALGAGTDFATISNLSLTATPIPEPAALFLVAALGAVSVLIRHRRARFA